MRLKEKRKYFKNLLPPPKKFSAQGAKKVNYGMHTVTAAYTVSIANKTFNPVALKMAKTL